MFVVYLCDKKIQYNCYKLEVVVPDNTGTLKKKKKKMNILEGILSRDYDFNNNSYSGWERYMPGEKAHLKLIIRLLDACY